MKLSFARISFGLLLFVVAVVLYIESSRLVVLPLLLGTLLAFILLPINKFFLNKKFSPRISALLCVLIVVLAFITFVYFFAIPLINSSREFLISLPSFVLALQSRLGISNLVNALGIYGILEEFVHSGISQILNVQQFSYLLQEFIKWAYILCLTPMFAYFIIKDKKSIKKFIMYLLPQRHKEKFYLTYMEVYNNVTLYIYGYSFSCLVSFTIFSLAFYVAGFSGWLLFAFCCAILSFIPFIGVFIGVLPALLAASSSSFNFWYVIICAIIVQNILNILVTKTIGNSIIVHPIFAITVMFLGSAFFGILGTVLAVPIFIVCEVVIRKNFVI